jgi:hypothetical protein
MDIESLESVVTAKHEIQSAEARLHANKFDGWAIFLQQKLAEMDGWFATKEALFQVGEVCHPKAIGDVCFQDLGWNDWLAEVDELKSACARAFNELESMPPPSL